MASNQHTLMKYDPATGEEKPYPSHAAQWRKYHGQKAWLYNPWTGDARLAEDVGSDTFGHLVLPPDENLKPVMEGQFAAMRQSDVSASTEPR